MTEINKDRTNLVNHPRLGIEGAHSAKNGLSASDWGPDVARLEFVEKNESYRTLDQIIANYALNPYHPSSARRSTGQYDDFKVPSGKIPRHRA